MAAFTNFATLSHNGKSLVSNTVSGEIPETLTAEKKAVAASYTPGGDVSYVISLVNSGDAALTGLTVTDNLGAVVFAETTVYPLSYKAGSLRYYVGGALQPEPTVTAGPPLTVGGLSVPAGGSAMLVYEAELTAYAPPESGSVITNTASVSGGALVTPVTATATLPVAEEAALSLQKALSPQSVAPGGTVTYSFTLFNHGNTAVALTENAVLTDDFSPVLADLTVELDGTPWTAGTQYRYDAATGAFATLPGQLAIPAASFTQTADGSWTVTPGEATLTVSGTLQTGV